MLYIISTPIGNLQDITLRALSTIKECDYLLCEDTRHSAKLLKAYELSLPLKSYHKFNEAKLLEAICKDLANGLTIGLLSDAGVPVVSDPGMRLVQACQARDLPYSCLPGPSAVTTTYAASGFSEEGFTFQGFLPSKQQQLTSTLTQALYAPLPSLFFVSPRNLLGAIEVIKKVAPEHEVFIARELTKQFEELYRSTATAAYEHFTQNPPRGEISLMVKGGEQGNLHAPLELVEELIQTFQLPKKEAIALAAKLLGVQKRWIYNQSL